MTSVSKTTHPERRADGTTVITRGATYEESSSHWYAPFVGHEATGQQDVTVEVTWTITIRPGESAPAS